jgi:hypothetical protein
MFGLGHLFLEAARGLQSGCSRLIFSASFQNFGIDCRKTKEHPAMQIPVHAERISFRTANTHRPPVVEPDFPSFEDGFSPRQARFGGGDERYTLALASRLKLQVETADESSAGSFAKTKQGENTSYTGITCNGQECRAAVALFQEDTGEVSVSEYRWAR